MKMDLTFRKCNITHEPFKNRHIRKILDREIEHMMYETKGKGTAIDPFARESFTLENINFITNDLNPDFQTDYNLEFNDFAETIAFRVNHDKLDRPSLVFFDPPYSLTQLKKQYDGIGKDLELWQTHNMWGKGKDALASIMQVGSRVVSLGWNTQGFGEKRGFAKRGVHVFEQISREGQYNIFVTIEEKVQFSLFDTFNRANSVKEALERPFQG